MQNSGIGNAVNPITSLANEEVYDIPMLLVIEWRAEPDKKDEPQHRFMGKITRGVWITLYRMRGQYKRTKEYVVHVKK